MAARLPLELFATIVDCLHGDLAALQSCSTVSPSFCHLAQRKLFYWVSLSIPSSDDRPSFGSAKVLFEHLEKSPHLVDYVRRLNIIDDGSTREMNAFTVQGDDAFIHVLSSFQHLSTIAFGRGPNSSQMIWGSMPPQMRSTILKALHCPTVTRIEILRTMGDFPLPLLVESRNLEHLRVYDMDIRCTMSQPPSSKISPPVHKMALKSLELGDLTISLGTIISTVFCNSEIADLSRLTSHCINAGGLVLPDPTKVIEALLHKVSGSLKSFHYSPPHIASRLRNDIDLSIPLHLECLRISIIFPKISFDAAFTWLTESLGRIPPCSQLKTIKLYFRMGRLREFPQYHKNLDWARLDATICNLSCLHSCHVYILSNMRSTIKMLGGIFPSTYSRGILRVTYWFYSYESSSRPQFMAM